ncbi:hypothetical protein NDU88_005187 [Pleurodeles waltl]|uniref:Uncharacterized protein n=1 Tax=Pleurodeles waltl TaxID=8319 RepID=A0AAV7WAC8_PLEWA|nr:hypothetical protein NDU88_005187 [Pleurodeles waltl]
MTVHLSVALLPIGYLNLLPHTVHRARGSKHRAETGSRTTSRRCRTLTGSSFPGLVPHFEDDNRELLSLSWIEGTQQKVATKVKSNSSVAQRFQLTNAEDLRGNGLILAVSRVCEVQCKVCHNKRHAQHPLGARDKFHIRTPLLARALLRAQR